MDLAEIKEKKKQSFGKDDMYQMPIGVKAEDWLIAEVERLASENETLRVSIGYADRQKESWLNAHDAIYAELRQLKKEHTVSLTLSRAEGRRQGLEEAGKIVDGVKSYYEQKSMEAELAVVDNAWSQAAYEAELAAAAIREAAQPKEGE